MAPRSAVPRSADPAPSPDRLAPAASEPGDEIDPLDPPVAPGWLRETPFWAISALLHLALVAVLLNIALSAPARKPVRLVTIDVREAPRTPPERARRDIADRLPVPLPPREQRFVITRPREEVTSEVPRGSELDNLTNVELEQRALNVDIGVAGPAAGSFGPRRGRIGLINEGGGPPTEDAVRRALDWLVRHQSSDGRWRARDFTETCRSRCRNRGDLPGDGRGFPEHDVGVTGLAVLAFAGWGETHQDGIDPRHVAAVRRAVRFLKRSQVRSDDPNEDGRIGPGDHEQWIYDHAIATMALAELLVMSNDVLGLQRPVEEAVELCLHAQNHGFGWKYGIKPGRNDTSVTGWMVLALKTARNARLSIPRERIDESLAWSLRWIERATSSATGKTGYEVPGDEGSRLANVYPEPYPYSKALSCMTAVGVLCRLFARESRTTPIVKRGVDILMREPPRWIEPGDGRLSTINLYSWYYASYALFQFGGRPWKRWNEALKTTLLENQRRDGDEDGSWDPIGEWGRAGGRVYSTALGAMTLEVYYRYVRVGGGET